MARAAGHADTGQCGLQEAMLHYAAIFLAIAVVAAVFGFAGIAAGGASIAKVSFFVFLAFAAATIAASMLKKGD